MRPIPILVALALVVAGTAWFVTRTPIADEPAQMPAQPSNAIAAPALEHGVALADPRDVEARAARYDAPPPTPVATPPEAPPAEVLASAPQSVEAMMIERKLVAKRLNDLSLPLLQAKLDSGDAEFLGAELNYHSRSGDNQLVFAIHMEQDRGAYRTVITREERPDIYVLKDRMLELDSAIRAIERKAAEAALATK